MITLIKVRDYDEASDKAFEVMKEYLKRVRSWDWQPVRLL